MQSLIHRIQSHSDPVLHFKETAEAICDLTATQDFKILPYRNPELPHFRKLSSNSQFRALFALNSQLALFELGLKRRLQAQLKWVSPLSGEDRNSGLLVVSQASYAPEARARK